MIRVLERPTIVLEEIVIDYLENVEDTLADEWALDIGRYPYIVIKGLVLPTDFTTKIVLHNDQFIPKIEIFFKEPTFKLIDPLFPIDDEIISLFIQSSSESLMPVRMDFKITEFNAVVTEDDMNYVITGLLNVNYLYLQESYVKNETSFNLLRTLAKKAGLGFASNIDDTNDLMPWINTYGTNMDFIQSVVRNSYKSDNSFMLSYVDFYYNLNYVDIETQLNDEISGAKGISFASTYFKDKRDILTDIIFTDHPDKINTNFYISKYNLINNSTAINLDIGYRKYVSYYDKVDSVRYEFIVDTLSQSDNVILKGGVGEKSELYENLMSGEYLGVIDVDNVHPNYLYAQVLNKQNLDFLQKVRMKITLKSMNFNVYRFQKVEVKLYKLKELNLDKTPEINEDTIENNPIDFDEQRLNRRLSGEWLIIGINYTFNKHGGFMQEITLTRRELGFSEQDFN